MITKNKKRLIVVLIMVIVSSAVIAAKFGAVSADGTVSEGALYKASVTEQGENLAISESEAGSMTSSLIKLLGALIIVVVGIYGFLLMLRKMMGRKFSGNRKKNLLEVIETTYIAQKKSVSLVRFADRAVLVGISDNNISVLAEIDSEETSKIVASTQLEQKETTGFSSVLNDARSRLIGLNMKGLRVLNSTKKTDGTQAA